MVRDETLQGFWFLPGQPESEYVSGSLVMSNREGLQLNLNGMFSHAGPLGEEHHVIFGNTSNGKEVTLHKCWQEQSLMSIPGYGVARYHVSMAFIGGHLSAPRDTPFNEYRARFGNLMEFVGGERFNVQRDGDIVRVAVPLADSLQADLSDATVTVDFQLRTEGDGLNDVQLRQEPSVRFRFKSPVTLDEFEHGLLRAFHSLIEFAGDAYVPTLDLVAVQEDTHFVDGESGPTLSPPTEIAVAFKPRIPQKSVTRKPNEMAFTLSTLGDNWGTHLERWHVVNQKYKPTLDHLFSLRRTDSLPVELRFLSLAQAVESYHRRAFPERRREPSAEFEERKLRIVRCLDESDERWFRQAVQFANEPTLADRLRELWDLMPPQARQAIGERDEFARSTKNARNHLTHFTKERLAETEPRALFRSGSCLLLVLQVLLLRELKVDAESALSSVWGQQILAPLKR